MARESRNVLDEKANNRNLLKESEEAIKGLTKIIMSPELSEKARKIEKERTQKIELQEKEPKKQQKRGYGFSR